MAPALQKAIVVQQDGSVALREIAIPKPGPDDILVKVIAVAQNPADCGLGPLPITSVFLTDFQGRRHGMEGAPGPSPDATSRGSSRKSGQMFRKAFVPWANASPVWSTEASCSVSFFFHATAPTEKHP